MNKIFFITNSCWNIFNFRSELIEKIIEKETKLIVSAPIDEHFKKLDLTKFKFIPISYRRNSMNLYEKFSFAFIFNNYYVTYFNFLQ